VSWPTPASLLRHRPPALLLDEIVARDDTALHCRSAARDWTWPSLLEACAQTAGLLAGMRSEGLDNRALIAEYRDVTVHAATYAGPARFEARFDRRILGFFRYAVTAHGAGDDVLLAGLVTLAPITD
jgi:predicted hotdog family 3-hydroxylacyl-ACP dehydratase